MNHFMIVGQESSLSYHDYLFCASNYILGSLKSIQKNKNSTSKSVFFSSFLKVLIFGPVIFSFLTAIDFSFVQKCNTLSHPVRKRLPDSIVQRIAFKVNLARKLLLNDLCTLCFCHPVTHQ